MALKLADKRSKGISIKQAASQPKARQCASSADKDGGSGGGAGRGDGTNGVGRSQKQLQAQSERMAELHALQYASIRYERKMEKRKAAAKEKAAAKGSGKTESNSASAVHVLRQVQAGSTDIFTQSKSKREPVMQPSGGKSGRRVSENCNFGSEPEPEPEPEPECSSASGT